MDFMSGQKELLIIGIVFVIIFMKGEEDVLVCSKEDG